MKKAVLYIHGKGGCADEAERYKPLFKGCDVLGFDYTSAAPWEAKGEFTSKYEELCKEYGSVIIIANSIGAYFTIASLSDKALERVFFISPIVDMEKLITDMMKWAGITEQELQDRQEIKTSFGEVLSWEYLCYVRENPVYWSAPTDILYAGNDSMTSYETISGFAAKANASLTIMENGEHWFHTDEQLAFLDKWLSGLIQKTNICD